MKKLILFTGLLFCSYTQAQIIKAYGDDQLITEGQTFTFNSLDYQDAAKLDIRIQNISSSTKNFKLKMIDVQNNDAGADVQFCFGIDCFGTSPENTTVPGATSGLALAPQAFNDASNHFANAYPGDTEGQPVTYQIAVIEVNNDGTQIGNNLITFNYVYQPTASTNDFISLKNIGITVNNTVIKDNLNITTIQKAKMEVYNITGQIVKTAAIQTGTQSINMSDLSAAPYIIRFTNDKNQSSQIKVVKQ